MTASQEQWKQEKWRRTRDSGLPRFLLIYGVLQFGLPLLIFLEVFASPSFFGAINILNLISNIVGCIAGGTAGGLSLWQYYKYRYKKNDSNPNAK